MNYYTAMGLIAMPLKTGEEQIIETICDFAKIPRKVINSKSRYRNITYARQLICYFLRKKTTLSYSEIGSLIGHRDHTTVMHSVKKIEDLIQVYPDVAMDINKVNYLIGQFGNSQSYIMRSILN